MYISTREKIIDAVIQNLKRITVAGGYNYTIRNVYDPTISIDSMMEFPSININDGDEDCISDVMPINGNNQLLHNSFTIEMDCIVNTAENVRKSCNKMLADIQKKFGINYRIDGTIHECIYSGCSSWGIHATKPIAGITVKYNFYYRQRIDHPEILN